MVRNEDLPQMGLFGDPRAIFPARQTPLPPLPTTLRLGTSSWSFPGWKGLVYRDQHSASELSRYGLVAYASHPWLRSVSIDRSYYAPLSQADFEHYRAQVPEAFSFVVKAWNRLTVPVIEGRPNPEFLNPQLARDAVIEPTVAGLGQHLDHVLFQFSALHLGQVQGVSGFCRKLKAFLSKLPTGPRYAVEVRNPELVGPDLLAALDPRACTYTINLMPNMPTLDQQFRRMQLRNAPRYLLRWLLAPGFGYQQAKSAFAPFDTIKVPQDQTRDRIARFIRWSAREKRDFTALVNNKAEGCAPLSIRRLAQALTRVDQTPER